MAEKNCTRTQAPCCQTAQLRRRQALEDMPTTHIAARDAQESEGCGSRWSEVEALLEGQNRLLCDILGSLNALAAAQLAQSKG